MNEKELMEQGEILCVTSVTTLDTLLGIIKHQLIRLDLIKEGVQLFVRYTIT